MAKYVMTINTLFSGKVLRAGVEFPSPEAKQFNLTEEKMEYFVQIKHAKKILDEKEVKQKEKEKDAKDFNPAESELYAPKQFKVHSFTSMKTEVGRAEREEEALKEEAKNDSPIQKEESKPEVDDSPKEHSPKDDSLKGDSPKENSSKDKKVKKEESDAKPKTKKSSGKRGRPKSKSGTKK